MKSLSLILAFSLLALEACNQQEPTAMKKVSFKENLILSPEDNVILSSEPSEHVSLEDYWDESNSIQSEAHQVIQRATNLHCVEAGTMAKSAIGYGEKARQSRNFKEAEGLITRANEAMSQAIDALSLCESRVDIEEAVEPASHSTR